MPETLGTDPGDGISGLGTKFGGATTGPIGMITKITIDGHEADEIEISTMNSPNGWKKFVAGMKDAKGATLDLLYERANMTAILAKVGGASEDWTCTLPDGSTLVIPGFIKKVGLASAMNDKISQPVTMRFTGPPVFNAASGA